MDERPPSGSRWPGESRGARRLCKGAVVPLAILALLPRFARAAEFERLEVSEDAGTYRIEASLLMDAPPQAVLGALLDFEAQKAMGPPMREVEVVETRPSGEALVKVVTDVCIGPFCAAVRQVQLVRFVPPGTIRGTVVPRGGDLKSGATAVEVSAEGGRTRVEMDCTLQPARRRPFFLPRGWVLNAIRRQAHQSAAGMEKLARRIGRR